jgi:hypothetical protein
MEDRMIPMVRRAAEETARSLRLQQLQEAYDHQARLADANVLLMQYIRTVAPGEATEALITKAISLLKVS